MAVIVGAAVLGSFMPSALLTSGPPPNAALTPVAPPMAPDGCFVASCNKGAPSTPAPSMTLLVASILGAGAAAAGVTGWRQRRSRRAAPHLPRGIGLSPFHPPQFS
jgi:hypothetical protein